MRNKSQKSVINVRHTVHMLVGDGSGKSEPSTGGGVAVSVGGVFPPHRITGGLPALLTTVF